MTTCCVAAEALVFVRNEHPMRVMLQFVQFWEKNNAHGDTEPMTKDDDVTVSEILVAPGSVLFGAPELLKTMY